MKEEPKYYKWREGDMAASRFPHLAGNAGFGFLAVMSLAAVDFRLAIIAAFAVVVGNAALDRKVLGLEWTRVCAGVAGSFAGAAFGFCMHMATTTPV